MTVLSNKEARDFFKSGNLPDRITFPKLTFNVGKAKDQDKPKEKKYEYKILDPDLSEREIVFNIKPLGKPRQTKKDVFNPSPQVVRYREYADELRKIGYGLKFDLPNILDCDIIIAIPNSYKNKSGSIKLKYRREGVKVGAFHLKKPDLDNVVKGLQDIFAKSDSHICKYKDVGKYWGEESKIVFRIKPQYYL